MIEQKFFGLTGKPGPNRGEINGRAVLTEALVRELRKRVAAGETRAVLAAEYGVTKQTIRDVSERRSWKHVA